MKIQSQALYAYLMQADVLNGTKDEIACAKREYRKLYKRNWKRKNRGRKELRITVTLKEYKEIKIRAVEYGVNPTAFSRTAILSVVGSKELIPHRDTLLELLKLLSMTAIASAKNTIPAWVITDQLERAETMLLEYVNGGRK